MKFYCIAGPAESMISSEDEDLCNVQASESEDEGPFGFKRNKSCQYHMVSFNLWWVVKFGVCGDVILKCFR